MFCKEDVEVPRGSSRHTSEQTATSQESAGSVPYYQGQIGPSRHSVDQLKTGSLQRPQDKGRRSVDEVGPSFRASGQPKGSLCGLIDPGQDIPEGVPIDSCNLGLDDVPSCDADGVQVPDEVPDVQSKRGWRSQRRGSH